MWGGERQSGGRGGGEGDKKLQAVSPEEKHNSPPALSLIDLEQRHRERGEVRGRRGAGGGGKAII